MNRKYLWIYLLPSKKETHNTVWVQLGRSWIHLLCPHQTTNTNVNLLLFAKTSDKHNYTPLILSNPSARYPILIYILLPLQKYTHSSSNNNIYGIMCMTLISNISKWLICKVFVRTISSRLLGRRNYKWKLYNIYAVCAPITST